MVEQESVPGGELRGSQFHTAAPDYLERDSAVVVDLTTGEPRLGLSRAYLSHDAPLIAVRSWKLLTRRIFDLVGASLALVVLSPLLLLVALVVKASSPGPMIFKQARVGKDGREFTLFKFRSMRVDAEEERPGLEGHNEASGPVFKIRDDPRLTSIGSFLRRSSIDELPQLWNVLKGDMCLVGPRPPIPEEVVKYSDWELQRLKVKPGITCIWQVSGRAELDFETWVRMDIEYIENWSLWLDLKLLAKTIPAVISGRGAY